MKKDDILDAIEAQKERIQTEYEQSSKSRAAAYRYAHDLQKMENVWTLLDDYEWRGTS